MPSTLAEAVQELERFKQQRAVWMEVVDHLSKFVDDEVEQAQQPLHADGCVSQNVPQDVIAEIINSINEETVAPLNDGVYSLENLQVEETNVEEASGKKGKSAKTKRRTGKKSVRVVPQRARGADKQAAK